MVMMSVDKNNDAVFTFDSKKVISLTPKEYRELAAFFGW